MGVRLIGLVFMCDGLLQGLLGLARELGVDIGAASTAKRDLLLCAVYFVGGFSFVASARELATARYRGGSSDQG